MGQGVRRSSLITSMLLARNHVLSTASVRFPYRATSRLFVTVRTHATLLLFCFSERAEDPRCLNANLLSTRKGWVSRSDSTLQLSFNLLRRGLLMPEVGLDHTTARIAFCPSTFQR
jgi:hypothetical protein